MTMTKQWKNISIIEARTIAEAAARLNLQGFLTDESVTLLRAEVLEAEHCWMFFRNPEIYVPADSALIGDWAYVVSRYGDVRDVADLYGQQGLIEYLKKMSDYFGDRRTRMLTGNLRP